MSTGAGPRAPARAPAVRAARTASPPVAVGDGHLLASRSSSEHGTRPLSRSLLQHDAGAVRTLTLSRPERLNALDHGLRDALVEALGRAATDEAVRCVLLTGSGQRAFCAGQDINESATLSGADEGDWIGSWARMFAA